MAKLRIDLALLPKSNADEIRNTVRWAISQGFTGLALKDGDTVLDSDFVYGDLHIFVPPANVSQRHLKKQISEAMLAKEQARAGDAAKTVSASDLQKLIEDECTTDEYLKDMAAELVKSRRACRKLKYPPDDPDQDDLFDGPGQAALRDTLEKKGGIVIGGDHKDNTHRDPIMAALDSGEISKKNNTGLIFLEELSNEFQPLIDAYLKDEKAEMSPVLKVYLASAKDAFQLDFAGMIERAKKNGVRVVGIDTPEAKVEGVEKSSAMHNVERCAKMNISAAEIMKEAIEASGGQSFVALVGEEHINTDPGGVPGLAQLLGVPGATIGASGRLKPAKEDKSRRGMPSETECLIADACLREITRRFDGNPNDTADWRDQFAEARAAAKAFVAKHPVLPGFDMAAVMDSKEIKASLDSAEAKFKERASRKDELRKLLADAKPAEFKAKLDEFKRSDPELLKHDFVTNSKTSVLAEAVTRGQSTVIADIAAAGAPVDNPDESAKVFEKLISRYKANLSDASISKADADRMFSEATKAVLKAGVDPNGSDKKHDTPLLQLVWAGITNQLDALIAAGADPDPKALISEVPDRSVMEVAMKKNPEIIGILAARGASVNTMADGGTLLQLAIRANQPDAVSALLAAGADVNRPLDKDGQTELHAAIKTGNQTMIDELIAAGADPKRPDVKGDTALDALLAAEVTRRVEEATNGPSRALKAKRAEIEAKEKEISDLNAGIAAANARADQFSESMRTGKGAQGAATAELLQLLTVTLPDLQGRLGTAISDRAVLRAALPALELADPLHGLLTVIDANIEALETNLKSAGPDAARRMQEELQAEKAHRARAQAEQPMDPDLIAAGVGQLKAALAGRFANAASIADIRDLVQNAPEVGATITYLKGKMTDRKTDILEVDKAMRAKDFKALDKLFAQDPTLIDSRVPGDENERTLIQTAAGKLDQEMITYLLTKKPDLTLRTKAGGTAMHELFAQRVNPRTPSDGKNGDQRARELEEQKQAQCAMMLELLAADPTTRDMQDSMGMSVLHLACLDGNPDAVSSLIHLGADENLRDARGWRPIDVVTATTKPMAERAYEEASKLNEDRSLVAPTEQDVSTVEILMRATTCENPGDVAKMREMYEQLYADPALRPVLDLAALDAANEHAAPNQMHGTEPTPTGLRIFVSERAQIGLLYNSYHADYARKLPHNDSPRGAYEETSHVVMFGGGIDKDGNPASPGTLIHELTHSCARMLYGTDDIPCAAPEGAKRVGADGLMDPSIANSDYVAAIMQDARNSALLCSGNPDEAKIRERLFERLDDSVYQKKGDKALLQEYLVSVPQLIAEYGIEPVRKAAPALVDYFTGSFSDACRAKAKDDSYGQVARQVNNDALIQRVGAPSVKPVADTIPASHEDASLGGVLDRVGRLYTAAHGEIPTPDATNKLPTNISLPTKSDSFALPANKQKAFDRAMKDVSKAMRGAFGNGDMPADISSDLLREMTTTVTALMSTQSGKALRNAVQKTTGDFIRDAKRADLEKRAQTVGALDHRQMAELVLIRAEDAVWAQNHPDAPPPPHPDYDRKGHKKLVDDITAKLDTIFDGSPEKRRAEGRLTSDPAVLNKFIEDQKAAVIQANAALSERNNTVKLDRKRARNAWFDALKKIA